MRTRSVLQLVILGCWVTAGCELRADRRPNVLFLLIDSLRADHLGLAGYQRPTSPCLDSLAAAGAAFTSCTAQAPFTKASVPSVLTGMYPTSAMHWTPIRAPGSTERLRAAQLTEGAASIAAILRPHGYVSAAVSASVVMNRFVLGLWEQFDFFDGSIQCTQGHCARSLNELALAWLSRRRQGDQWLCYVHYMDVHSPYGAPKEYAARFSNAYDRLPVPRFHGDWEGFWDNAGPQELEHIVGMYDAEIAYVDAQIRELLCELRRLGVAENLLVIVAADHGDEFLDHGAFGHGHTLYQEQIECPLILAWREHIPAGVRVDCCVRNIDIVPTVLDLVGVQAPEGLDGASLVPHFNGRRPQRTAFSEMKGVSVRQGRWKLWQDPGHSVKLFDLLADPGEQMNLAEAEPETLHRLLTALEVWATGLASPPVHSDTSAVSTLDPAGAAQLRALGYIE